MPCQGRASRTIRLLKRTRRSCATTQMQPSVPAVGVCTVLSDHTGLYRAGDVCDLDDSVVHTPTAGTDGCICVVAQDRPVRFSSLIVRLARPWHGM